MSKVLNEKEIFSTKNFSVKEVEVELRNKKRASYPIVEFMKEVAIIVPITDDGKLVMIREYYPALNDYLLGFPKGKIEQENSMEAANRELQEEAGYKAGKLIGLGGLVIDPRHIRHKTKIFLAVRLVESKLEQDEDEDIEVIKVSFEEFDKLVGQNKITEARVIAAFYMADSYLKKHSIP